jgi:hypothetical protein
MAKPIYTKDERKILVAGRLEQLVNTIIREDQVMSHAPEKWRASVLRMIAQVALKKSTQANMRQLVQPMPIASL